MCETGVGLWTDKAGHFTLALNSILASQRPGNEGGIRRSDVIELIFFSTTHCELTMDQRFGDRIALS
jgi:hypothetical protein